ncbi:histone-arginine methyltransferase CARMER isoform X2 [Macrosteles quadrilineatus]|uniref:histone-arginine methyltransferase CARMER isoform X2 n=1 Tax=Macrosteles quadrilineatus TaxID=74068 RepID=UPI0023E20956|nr:histone-arginine methyltransferase CARMER isoform X2 [Macrosteles quadrilineatus]
MAKAFNSVVVSRVGNDGDLSPKFEFPVTVIVEYDPQGLSVKLKRDSNNGRSDDVYEFPVHRLSECARIGTKSYIFNNESESLCLRFREVPDANRFHSLISETKLGKNSVFSERTDDSSAVQYFQFYGYLSQQQNMLQDYVRTSTYQRAVLANSDDFRDKVVLDVGAGSGILSFFAVQAGAKRVYAVEASSMALHAETLVASNNLKDKIHVIAGKIEEVELPEMVDVIISEPMGYMLYNERMLETYLHAKKWLKPNGIMFPSRGDLHIAPFMDDSLFMEQTNKANFWVQTCFHGVDLSSMRDAAMKEYFRQPIVDTFDMRICMAKSVRHSVDFSDAHESDLHRIEIPLEFYMLESGTVHGLAFWFDVAFSGSSQTIWLSTAPTESLTHWYQVRCLLENPIFAKAGQLLTGKVILQANQRQSYDVTMDLCIEGNEQTRSVNTLDLKNPYFRYTGQPVAPPPGMSTTSPSEAYWTQLDAQAVNMVNGISVNGLGEVQMEATQNHTNLVGLGAVCVPVSQPNIHPGSISSTGRQRAGPGPGTATSTGAAQLIGGGISPTLFTSPQTHQLVLGNTAHFPVNNSLMIGDYVTPTSGMLSVQGYRQ